ncbi:hypothetical protein H0X09_01455 [Candidatus Saccharibacteria bacterium]|nr:hypothetical protein [Candidatus Saccharibacteria bacterium]
MSKLSTIMSNSKVTLAIAIYLIWASRNDNVSWSNVIGIGLMLYSAKGFGKRIEYELARQSINEKEN